LAANISLYDVLELWADRWRRQDARGEGRSVRDAAAGMVGFAPRDAADRFWKERRERLGQCKLELPPAKTRLIALGRCAADRRRRRAQGKPAPVALLGFTPRCRTTSNGKVTVRRKTLAQRLRTPLPAVQETRRGRLPWPIPQQGAWLHRVLLGP
jgi:hypothetical protein